MLARQVQHSLVLSALFALSSQDYVTNLIFPLRYLVPHPTVYCTFISRVFFFFLENFYSGGDYPMRPFLLSKFTIWDSRRGSTRHMQAYTLYN